MSGLAGALTPVLVGLCLAAAGGGVARWLRPESPAAARAARWAAGAAAGAAVFLWVTRTLEAGHLPLFGTYESSLSLALAVLVAAAVVDWRRPGDPGIWPVAGAVAAVLLIHGLGYDRGVWALTISERSMVVDLHAIAAWAAFGALTVNAGFALRHLLLAAGSQSAAGLEFSLHLGYLLHTAMMASGSFYKFLLFGTAWSFDPVETLGFAAWMAYGTVLHLHLIAGWRGRRLAGWCLALFVLLVVSYRGIVYFPAWSTYHIFDVDLRIHLTGQEGLPGGAP